jgi:hypothetical protein
LLGRRGPNRPRPSGRAQRDGVEPEPASADRSRSPGQGVRALFAHMESDEVRADPHPLRPSGSVRTEKDLQRRARNRNQRACPMSLSLPLFLRIDAAHHSARCSNTRSRRARPLLRAGSSSALSRRARPPSRGWFRLDLVRRARPPGRVVRAISVRLSATAESRLVPALAAEQRGPLTETSIKRQRAASPGPGASPGTESAPDPNRGRGSAGPLLSLFPERRGSASRARSPPGSAASETARVISQLRDQDERAPLTPRVERSFPACYALPFGCPMHA